MSQATDTQETPMSKGQAALQAAMASGKAGFLQQLRYVLMLAQLVRGSLPVQEPPPKTLTHARLEALVRMARQLPSVQRARLLHDVTTVTPLAARLVLLAQLLPHLTADERERHAQTIWQHVGKLDAVSRARTLCLLCEALPPTNGALATPIGGFLLAQAQRLREVSARARAFSGIAAYLPAPIAYVLWGRVLDEVARLRDEGLQAKTLAALLPDLPAAHYPRVRALIEGMHVPASRAQSLAAFLAHVPCDEALCALLLDTLGALVSAEETFAQAFMNLVPFLTGAPQETLDRVFSLVMMMQRPALQARLLVAMAVHVAPDLQGEAIAAAHGVANERERAELLAQLAPHLPSNLLVASLAVAYTMQEHDSRLYALTHLAHYVPESAKAQTSRDALAAAVSLRGAYERVLALVSLCDVLDGALKAQALTSALESVARIDNEAARGRALSALAPYLTPALQERALEQARNIRNAEHRLNGLLGLLPHLPAYYQPEVVQDLFACVVTMPMEYKRAHALISIAPVIGTDDLAQLEDLTTTLSDPADTFNVMMAMLQYAPPEERERIAKLAWDALHQIEISYERANAMAQLLPYLSESAKESLKSLAYETVGDIEDDYDRVSALLGLAPLLLDAPVPQTLPPRSALLTQAVAAALSVAHEGERLALLRACAALWQGGDPDAAFALWQASIQPLAGLPLPETLSALGALMPILVDFVPESALLDVAQLLGLR